jgi:hypothetical protein
MNQNEVIEAFDRKGNLIPNIDMSIFEIDAEKGRVNITKLAKACGKDIRDWKKLVDTKAYIKSWEAAAEADGVIYPIGLTTIKGGNNEQGTWAPSDIAIKVAEWISPDFEVKTKKILNELFQTGSVSIKQNKLPINPLDCTRSELIFAYAEEAKMREDAEAQKKVVLIENDELKKQKKNDMYHNRVIKAHKTMSRNKIDNTKSVLGVTYDREIIPAIEHKNSELKRLAEKCDTYLDIIKEDDSKKEALMKSALVKNMPTKPNKAVTVTDDFKLVSKLGDNIFNTKHKCISGTRMNKMLQDAGYHVKRGKSWIPTEKGRSFCQVVPVKNSNNIIIREYTTWKPSVKNEPDMIQQIDNFKSM